jgi:hypothetical protein
MVLGRKHDGKLQLRRTDIDGITLEYILRETGWEGVD